MDQEKTAHDDIKHIIRNLQDIKHSKDDLERHIFELREEFKRGNQEDQRNSAELINKLLEICLENSNRMQNIQPHISSFQEKVFYRNKQAAEEEAFLMPIRNEEAGLIEHGIIEQIEMIDDQAKGNY